MLLFKISRMAHNRSLKFTMRRPDGKVLEQLQDGQADSVEGGKACKRTSVLLPLMRLLGFNA